MKHTIIRTSLICLLLAALLTGGVPLTEEVPLTEGAPFAAGAPLVAAGLTVPVLQLESSSMTLTDPSGSQLTGTLSIQSGQRIVLLDATCTGILAETRAASTGSSGTFRLPLPEDTVTAAENTATTLYVKALATSQTAASKSVPVTIRYVPEDQETSADPTAASAKKAYTIRFCGNGATSGSMTDQTVSRGVKQKLHKNRFRRTGYQFAGWSLKPNNQVMMKHYQLGKVRFKNRASVKNLAKANQTIRLYACWKGSGAQAACDWARRIASDDSFNYGARPIASRHGCYYCGTNGTKVRLSGGNKKYYKTYVCMTFITAAYVHGANEPDMKCPYSGRRCLDGYSRLSVNLKTLGKIFRHVGKPAIKRLKPGDVLLAYKNGKNHTAMYLGSGKYVQAVPGHGPWSKQSIAVWTLTSKAYRKYDAVLRYR